MSASTDLYDAKNIQRAWRWIKSNPDARYKAYFRDLYSVYEVAEEPLLERRLDKSPTGQFVTSRAMWLWQQQSLLSEIA